MIEQPKTHDRKRYTQVRTIAVWALFIMVLATILGVFAAHQFYPSNEIVSWMWKLLWGFIMPALIVAAVWLTQRKVRKNQSKNG